MLKNMLLSLSSPLHTYVFSLSKMLKLINFLYAKDCYQYNATRATKTMCNKMFELGKEKKNKYCMRTQIESMIQNNIEGSKKKKIAKKKDVLNRYAFFTLAAVALLTFNTFNIRLFIKMCLCVCLIFFFFFAVI